MTARRRITVRVLAALGLLMFTLSVVMVLQEIANPVANEAELEQPGSPEAQYGADHPDEFVHVAGAVATLIVGASGIIALILRPRATGSAQHVLVAMVGSIVVMGIMGDPDNHGGMAGPFDVAFLAFVLFALIAAVVAIPGSDRHGRPFDRRVLILAAAGIPFLWYGVEQALIQRNTWPPLADPHHQAHWYTMAVLAVMVVFVASTAGTRRTGSVVALGSSAVGAAALGLASLIRPDAASAMGWPLATGAIAWAAYASFLAVAPGHDRETGRPVARV